MIVDELEVKMWCLKCDINETPIVRNYPGVTYWFCRQCEGVLDVCWHEEEGLDEN